MATNGASKENTVAIVGGGIGGLGLAIGLLNKNVPFHIYEAAPAFTEIGAGLSFAPNSIRAMSLLSPEMEKVFYAEATNNAYPDHERHLLTLRRGEDEVSTKIGRKIVDVHCPTGQLSVHRARFLDAMVGQLPGDAASFGKRLGNIEDNRDHVVLHFKDGTSAHHAAVICCDGIKSRGRQILLGEDHPAAHAVFSGKFVYRGLIPMDLAAAKLGDEVARNAQMYVGHGRHILTFPIAKGKMMNVVAFGSSAEWNDPQWVKPALKSDMLKDFSSWTTVALEIITLLQKPDIWALFHMLPAPFYNKNRICLLGDAAHASTPHQPLGAAWKHAPHQGAGAGMAIEDALIMASLLGGLNGDFRKVDKAFEVFDRVRRERTQRLVSTSHEAGFMYDLELEETGDDLYKVAENMQRRLQWIWGIDMDGHVEEAKALLKEKL